VHTTETELYESLRRARAFMDACYDHPLDLDQISRQVHFSRYHFLRLFSFKDNCGNWFSLTQHK
jgi:AraC-like DNA-binding protein